MTCNLHNSICKIKNFRYLLKQLHTIVLSVV